MVGWPPSRNGTPGCLGPQRAEVSWPIQEHRSNTTKGDTPPTLPVEQHFCIFLAFLNVIDGSGKARVTGVSPLLTKCLVMLRSNGFYVTSILGWNSSMRLF